MNEILITQEMQERHPITAMFCGLINAALKKQPDMTLAEFAGIIDAHKEERRERLIEAEKRQFGVKE